MIFPLESGRGNWTRRVLNPHFPRLGISSSAVPHAPIHANSKSGRWGDFVDSACVISTAGPGESEAEVAGIEDFEGDSGNEVEGTDFVGY